MNIFYNTRFQFLFIFHLLYFFFSKETAKHAFPIFLSFIYKKISEYLFFFWKKRWCLKAHYFFLFIYKKISFIFFFSKETAMHRFKNTRFQFSFYLYIYLLYIIYIFIFFYLYIYYLYKKILLYFSSNYTNIILIHNFMNLWKG